MTDEEIDCLHDSLDCWIGYGIGARFDYRTFARKVETAERERCAAEIERLQAEFERKLLAAHMD